EVNGEWQVIYGGGDGWLYAFEATKGELRWKFDCNPKGVVYKPGGRSDFGFVVATPVVYEKHLYVGTGENPEHGPGVGHLWCFDAKTGKRYWEYDLKESTWNSPYYVDGRVLLGVDNGDLFIFQAGKVCKDPLKIEMGEPLKTPPIAANGVLYISNGLNLFAIG